MTFTFIAQDCPDLPVATCCRVMKVSTSGFYAWLAQPVSQRDLDDAYLTNTIVDIHRLSRGSYGSPRVHAELRLGEGVRCGRKRVERLMRQAGIEGVWEVVVGKRQATGSGGVLSSVEGRVLPGGRCACVVEYRRALEVFRDLNDAAVLAAVSLSGICEARQPK